MKRIGIVAALPGELKPLARGWEKRGKLLRGQVGNVEAVATAGGMGSRAAELACASILEDGSVDALLSVGWAGSLSCGLKPPTACAVSEVVDTLTGETFSTANGDGQRLLTLDHVAGRDEKRSLGMQYQAALVDMEAAAVARVALARGLGFYCFKAVTDGPSDQLPDLNRFTGSDGTLRMAAFLSYVAGRPRFWPGLWRLGKNSSEAAVQLAHFIHSFLARSQ